MSAENVTPAPEAEDAVVETPVGQGSRVAEQDGAAVSEAVRRLEEEGDVAADYLEELLDSATIGEAPKESGVAQVGSVLHVYYDDDEDDKETFLLGTRGLESSNPDLETYSTDAPLGAAIVGAKNGESRTYQTPNGNDVKVTLISAEPYDPDLDVPRDQQ